MGFDYDDITDIESRHNKHKFGSIKWNIVIDELPYLKITILARIIHKIKT